MNMLVAAGIAAGGAFGALARWRLDVAAREWAATRVSAVRHQGAAILPSLTHDQQNVSAVRHQGAATRASAAPTSQTAAPSATPTIPVVPMLGIGLVNVLGCLFVGLVTGLLAADSPARLIISTGFLGGFTTFSTAVVDVWTLWRHGRRAAGVAMALGVWALSLAAALFGLAIADIIH